jgi:serine/threonine protein kinase/Tol biopolymer transport system component
MNLERWQQIEDLFQSTLERAPQERTVFLVEACGGDESLCREVESLIASYEQDVGFIETPACEFAVPLFADPSLEVPVGHAIGPYTVLATLGVGGMGEVYLAEDTRLGRKVALKLLPALLTYDRDRLRRFEQEARAASALNHPHILTIYEIGQVDDLHFIATEFVDGETLRQRMAGRMVPISDVLTVAEQVAAALAAAHAAGIVHRDMKPENIMVRRDGYVKIVDFGLAKLTTPDADGTPAPTPAHAHSETLPGVVLGTVRYMSPEQVRGLQVDARTDLWSLGVVLYEMLTGHVPFEGPTPSDVLAAILEREPPSVSHYAREVPEALAWVVTKALTKEREERYQTAREMLADVRRLRQRLEVATALERSVLPPSDHGAIVAVSRPVVSLAAGEPAPPPTSAEHPVRAGKRRKRGAIFALVVLVVALAGVAFERYTSVGWSIRRTAAVSTSTRFTIALPENVRLPGFGPPAISPDGRHLVFSGLSPEGGPVLLWLRPLDALEAQPLRGTERANSPFWSPDSRFIGFFAAGKLKTVAISGGPVHTLASVTDAHRGGTWNRDGIILFAPSNAEGLYRVPASGGAVTPMTMLDASRQEMRHMYPAFLPDGRHFMYLVGSTRQEHKGLYVGSLDSKETKRVLDIRRRAVYAPPGYLLFARQQTLMAQPFDAHRLRVTGELSLVAEQVGHSLKFQESLFSVSETGVLVYQDAASERRQLVWFDRGGKQLGFVGQAGIQSTVTLSPDAKRVALVRDDPQTGNRDIWLVELARGTSLRLTSDEAWDRYPIWSPDGSRIVFATGRAGVDNLYHKPSSGTGSEEVLFQSMHGKYPIHWSADGRFIVYQVVDPKTFTDIWVLPLTGERQPFPFLQTEFSEEHPQFSPDGRWLAYTSNESGRPEIYVQSFPPSGGKWQVSTHGGAHPRWRGDGQELFYLDLRGKKLLAVAVKGDTHTFEADVPVALFDINVGRYIPGLLAGMYQYDVTADGQRFLVNTLVEEPPAPPITVVLNWIAGLKR